MNTEQKLTKIRAKCLARIEYAKSNVTDLYGGDAIAAWKATIAAIDMAFIVLGKGLNNDICDNEWRGCRACEKAEELVSGILKAWEGLV